MAQTRSDQTAKLNPDEVAALWILRQQDAPFSEREDEKLADWIAASPDHAAAYRKAETAWSVFETGDDPNLTALRKSALATGPDRRRFAPAMLGIAASLAACFLVVAAVSDFSFGPSSRPTLASEGGPSTGPVRGEGDAYSTAKGARRTIVLDDGTRIVLNTDTAVRVDYDDRSRNVHLLRGQALFEVAKNPERPFIVRAADRRITALGTAFDVRLEAGRVKVVLIEGKVSVGIKPGEGRAQDVDLTILQPGQSLTADYDAPARVQAVDVKRELLWRDGFVQFDDRSLGSAVAEMNRYSDTVLVISDPTLSAERISGLFKTGDPVRFVDLVGQTLPIEAKPEAGGQVRVTRREN